LYVADACSGLTSIVTLLPLACIVAYFLSHGVWRRVVVVASVVPLALAANIFRVIVTVQLVSSQGVEFAQGLLHESFGVATYVLGTLAVIGVARILR
jgi:exosortase/archaeosortase family protein